MSATTRLGDIQKQLCSIFQKQFPKIAVSLNAHGRFWEDFDSRPFEEASAGAVYTAVFEITTQMQHLDQQRKAQMISLFADRVVVPSGGAFSDYVRTADAAGRAALPVLPVIKVDAIEARWDDAGRL